MECRRSSRAVLDMLTPRLPLDRTVPTSVLKRRGAISFGSSSKLEGSSPPCPRLQVHFTLLEHFAMLNVLFGLFQRRGAISFVCTDYDAVYVRRLGKLLTSGVCNEWDGLA